MRRSTHLLVRAAALLGCMAMTSKASAGTVITTFDDYFSLDGLFAWADAVVESTATNYSITDSGYGSGYKDINPNIDATGETTLQLTVILSAPGVGSSDPISGPIVSLVDGDGTFVNYAWYGRSAGQHVLIALLNSPTYVTEAGTVPGLDLSRLDFFHLQDDPGSYSGQYTITFEDLCLLGAPGPTILQSSYDAVSGTFTVSWTSKPEKSYAVYYAGDLGEAFQPLQSDIASGGDTTTTAVVLPAVDMGFIQIVEQ